MFRIMYISYFTAAFKSYFSFYYKIFVGLSMMCYAEEAEVLFLYLARYSFGESQPKGRIGKRLYLYGDRFRLCFTVLPVLKISRRNSCSSTCVCWNDGKKNMHPNNRRMTGILCLWRLCTGSRISNMSGGHFYSIIQCLAIFFSMYIAYF